MTTGVEPRWIASAAEFDAVCDELTDVPGYALDTEFHRERTYFPKVALMQLRVEGNVALVDTLDIDIAPFRPVLESKAMAVLHAAEQDLEILQTACGAMPGGHVRHADRGRVPRLRLEWAQRVAGRELDIHLPKGDRLTNWTRARSRPTS